ncbi:MAG: hypothetical protein GTN78_20805 [Gemmatimonadales bacterium]|nr:hypothetical protein [Gemmatimonadales bacterium]NIN10123.1 hypothetical protein [Gemmatimonadales bacterium]NIR02607.1 hypothetical protein [Gemmatimonadales bacterium]NIS66301.1 hypothetical protein [Gemmatimonadales bacterium]
MRTRIYLPAVLLVVPFATAVAQQQPPPLEPGQRVRVTVPTRDMNKHVETFRRLRGDTLVLESMRCPLSDVTRLEVHRGEKSKAGKGALFGGLVGAGLGVVASVVWAAHDCEFIDNVGCEGEEVAVMAGGTAILGAAGALLGAGVGALIQTDRWEEVPLDRLRVSLVPQRDGFGIGASISF